MRAFSGDITYCAIRTYDGRLARLLHGVGCDPQTIRQGREELAGPEDPAAGRVRKKGADAGG